MRIVIVADSGAALKTITACALELPEAQIVRHCHGHASCATLLARIAPDLVLVDEMGWPRLALRRVSEVREALPHALVVVRAAQPDALWLTDALRAGASAVVSATAGAATIGLVLTEVVCERELEVHEATAALAA